MNNLTNPLLLFLSLTILCSLACSQTTNQMSKFDKSQVMELKMKKDINSDSISFDFKNTGKEDYPITVLTTDYNRLILVTESGKKIEHFAWADQIPQKIKPGETKHWDLDIQEVIRHYNLQQEKNLKIIWSVDGVESAPLLLNN